MKRINVLYAVDDNYAPYTGISLKSLLENNKNSRLTIYFGDIQISQENKRKIEQTVEDYGQQLVWLDVKQSFEYIDACKTKEWQGSKATWVKVFILWQLPDEVESILYIDGDTLVLGDISPIFDINLEDKHLGAVIDSVGFRQGEKLGVEQYFNAGVLLFDVKYWKNNEFRENFIDHLYENADKYDCTEQDLLNDFFREKIYVLPIRFNLQGFHLLYDEKTYFSVFSEHQYYSMEEVQNAKNQPIIIHFFRILGDYPWNVGNLHPARKMYEEWKIKSYWKDFPNTKKNRSFIFKMERFLYKLFPASVFIKIFKIVIER